MAAAMLAAVAAAAGLVAAARGAGGPEREARAAPGAAWLPGFHRDGFVQRLGALPGDLAERLRATVAGMEAAGVDFNRQVVNPHLSEHPELMEVATEPGILDAVQAVVGPDVLLVSTAFFAKYPKVNGTGPACLSVVGAHQDRQYWAITPPSAPVVSVWVAVDDADVRNGAMQFFKGTHVGPLRHEKYVDACSALMSAQSIPSDLLPADPVDIELKSGQYALFDGMLAHRSARNTSPRRRMGFTMIFAAAHVEYEPMGYAEEDLYAGDWRVPSVLVSGSAERVRVPLASPGQPAAAPGARAHRAEL